MSAVRSVQELIDSATDDVGPFIQTVAGNEDEPAFRAFAEYGVRWSTGACHDEASLADIAQYRAHVDDGAESAWMDNTTLVTASALMSDAGVEVMTPLTVWDLATFARAVVSFDRIFHHAHPDIDDGVINARLGATIFTSVPLPIRPTQGNLPSPWDGAHRFMCDIWMDAHRWLRRLHGSVAAETLDGKQVRAVTEAWRAALGRDDLKAEDLVDYVAVDHRWTSPSNRLLLETADVTRVDETRAYLDPTAGFQALEERRRELGLPDDSAMRRGQLLSDLNIRAYVNQRMADFFEVPYACSAARLPFRQHLYDRWTATQEALTTANVIDDRYGKLAEGVQLRLPVFLAVALRESAEPKDLWSTLAQLRSQAAPFRAHRAEMDQALARGDLKQAKQVARALNLSVTSLLEVAGSATVAAGTAVLSAISKGDVDAVRMGVAGATAASGPVLKSSFAERLLWRLRKPQLLWINDLVDQAQRLTEGLPDFARVWRLPLNRQAEFATRFNAMAALSGRPRDVKDPG